ncbi:peptide ABC transporter substrate-binding protein [Calderihabitans maritimus]|uniref:Solute-binding protein family 5 domain-containing protein n=1 Tax=Calderihabitans maritimus TaxID=1246530 RepID=A0A1Z5HU54_9FIRM|nr:peptide ABC transporter substrate-binding protein [Calderihabitans maritimus]GAW92861.1 hypothetical protein KKC1_20090 [Calderihabitans maritimus]
MSWKKLVLPLLFITLIAAFLTGCGAKEEATAPAGGEQQSAAEEMVLRYNLATEPETLDPALATGQPELTAINAFFEGLTRLDESYEPQPAMAESWDISEDGLVYTFHLRDGIKWTNGDPVTAYDFEYAWKRVLNPDTAADYAYMLWYIKNAEKYTSGEVSADEVGIKAIDEKTLEVTLEAPAPYFLSLTAFPTYFPVHKATVEADPDGWAGEAETIVSNGPFKLIKWEHKNVLELVPNENYWDRETVKLDKLVFYTVEEESTELAMFETGDLDILDNPPLEEMDRLKNEGLVIGSDLAVYYYMFNVEKEPFDDPRVRRAFAMAIERQALIDAVTKAGQRPAYAFVPYGIINPVTGKDFREEGGDYFTEDIEEAKRLLAEAGYPDGKGLPPIEILYNTSEGHKKIAEAIQQMWRKNLGVENVTLRNEEWGVYLESRDQGNFQVARAGWAADYLDPMTFLDMWLKDGGNNNTNWWDPEYEDLITTAKSTGDQKVRFEAMHKAEEILMRDMPIAPIYFYTDPYLMKDYVKGVVKLPFGPEMEFKHAYIEK